jgi:hypothetical protein
MRYTTIEHSQTLQICFKKTTTNPFLANYAQTYAKFETHFYLAFHFYTPHQLKDCWNETTIKVRMSINKEKVQGLF